MIYVLGVITSITVYIVINLTSGGWQGVLRLFSIFPVYWFFVDRPPLGIASRPTAPGFGGSLFLRTLVFSGPTVLISTFCFVLSRRYLVSRAFVTPSRRLKKLFESLDRFFEGANKSLGGVVLTRVDRSLPDGNPVAWREVTTRSLGQVRYLFRFLILIETPTLCLIVVDPNHMKLVVELGLVGLWIILLLVTCVTAANLIVRERQQRTLDVLIATPLKGSDIVQQKLAGVNRAIWICQIPMWTCLVFYLFGTGFDQENESFVLNQISMLVVYPWLLSWVAIRHSLSSKLAVMAVFKTFASCVLYCSIPLVVMLFDFAWYIFDSDVGTLSTFIGENIILLSPLGILLGHVTWTLGDPSWDSNAFPLTWLINMVIHGSVLCWFRSNCLARADQLLGRLSSKVPVWTDDETAPESI